MTYRILIASQESDSGKVLRLESASVGSAWRITGKSPVLTAAHALATHPSRRRIYAADGLSNRLIAFDPLTLRQHGSQPSGGALPCVLAVHPSGTFLVTAHYASAELTVHPIDENLAISPQAWSRDHHGSGPIAGRQERAHLHHVCFDTRLGTALVTDLGSDRIYEYQFDSRGRPTLADEITTPPGNGPRHSRFDDHGTLLVSDELSSSLSRYQRDPNTGRLAWTGSVDTRADTDGPPNLPSELVTRFGVAYVANRGRNTIGVIDTTGSQLSLLQEIQSGGTIPQHLALLDNHLLCANRRSNTITALPIERTGRLGPARVVAEVLGPSWITVLNTG